MGQERTADDPGVRALAWAQGRLLEALVGWWVDDTASSYEVYHDGGDTCSVRIWRRGGANFLRKAVIRLLTDKQGRPNGVTWNRSYSLDLEIVPIESVTWMAQKKAKPFVWRRWYDIVSQKELKASSERSWTHEEWEDSNWWSQSWWKDGGQRTAKKKEVNGTRVWREREKDATKEVNGARVWREREKDVSKDLAADRGNFNVMSLFENATSKSDMQAPSVTSTPSPTSKPAAEVIKDMLQPDKPMQSQVPDVLAVGTQHQNASAMAAAAAAANHVASRNAVASAHLMAQHQVPLHVAGSHDYRQYYRCANPDCWLLVNPDPVFGSRCTQQVAHQSLPRAPAEEPLQRSPLFDKAEDDGDGDQVEDHSQMSTDAAAAAAAAANVRPPGDWSAWSTTPAGVGQDAYGRPCMLPQQPYPFHYPTAAQYNQYQHAAAAAAFASALYHPTAPDMYHRPAALPLSAPPELPVLASTFALEEVQELHTHTPVAAAISPELESSAGRGRSGRGHGRKKT